MTKVIIYTRPSDGGTTILRPGSWARLCKSVEGLAIDPPQPLDIFLGRIISDKEFSDMQVVFAETEEEFFERIKQNDVRPGATNVRIVDEDEVPDDRTFRAALKHDLTHDMAKCRAIHVDRLRAERGPLLDELDRLYNRAVGQGKPKEAEKVEARRQALRDITDDPRIATATTPDELKVVIPLPLRSKP